MGKQDREFIKAPLVYAIEQILSNPATELCNKYRSITERFSPHIELNKKLQSCQPFIYIRNPEYRPPVKPITERITDEKKEPIINKRIRMIAEVVAEIKYPPMAIPDEGKRIIRKNCLEDKKLFSNSTFEKAWTKAGHRGVARLKNADKYASKR